MGEEIVSGQYMYRGKLLKLKVNQVRLSNKNMAYREIVEHPGAAVIIPLDDNQNVLMVRQYRSAAGRDLLEIPAGTLNDGEDPAICATRELKEETGYQAAQWESLGYFYASPGFSTERMYLYVARQLTLVEASPEDDEEITIEMVPFVEALEKIERGEILDAKTIVGLLRLWRKMNR